MNFFKNLPSLADGWKVYLGALALLVAALGKHFFPELFADVTLTNFDSVEGQGWAAYMIWAFRSALKKLEP